MDCFAEPVIGRAMTTGWLAMHGFDTQPIIQ